MAKQYFKIGKLVATFGLGGEIVLQHSLGKRSDLKGLEAIFLEESRDSFLPYFLESAKVKNEQETWIKLEGVDTREKAHTLTQKEAWLLEADFQQHAGKAAPISMLGFTLMDTDEERELGEILEVIEQPHQVLCRIIVNDIEALIPIHEETLDKIDQKKKQVWVTLPDGLLAIYGID